ncbi:expressed unknown protein [Seminavis robusta]|uniref:Uncharacterized protein n=1 Tax=Seminavis robusta TaxID=568900 RepID=A0A9N8HM41_9STRA|nr:expressed unknown protein [Seminavis robusta]|eukprot:Sro876_g214460.1 n/a (137) ;mRNA; f:2105-2515
MMSLSALQGATIVFGHAVFTRVLLSFTLRTYQYLEWDTKRKSQIETNAIVKEYQKAISNEGEYAALIVAPLLFLAATTSGGDDGLSQAATVTAWSQVAYVWVRTAIGYPKVPTIVVAVTRYAGLALIAAEMYKAAF